VAMVALQWWPFINLGNIVAQALMFATGTTEATRSVGSIAPNA